MFSLREFIKNGLLNAIGKMAEYQVILNAVGWHEKGVLTEEDLEEIENSLEAHKNRVVPKEVVEEPAEEIEEPVEEVTKETKEEIPQIVIE